jgi:hypothetical protein
VLRAVAAPVLGRNAELQNRHRGETCYVIGNGASLKNMDLTAFAGHPAIALNMLCVHTQYVELDVRYHVLVEPLFFYPFVKNPYTGQYQSNVFGEVFRRSFSRHPQVRLFANLSNFFGYRFPTASYIYHFGHRTADAALCDLSGAFSFMASSFYASIGLAIAMGFRRAILVGCDYTFAPQNDGHFYAAGPPRRSDRSENLYPGLFAEAAKHLELSVVTDTGVAAALPSRTYQEHAGRPIQYRENVEIVRAEDLELLHRAFELQQLTQKIRLEQSPVPGNAA